MKTIKILPIFTILSFLLSCCAGNDIENGNNQNEGNQQQGTIFIGGITSPSGAKPYTRTSLDVTLPGGTTVDYFWEQGDKVWTAENIYGVADITTKSATAKFRMGKDFTASTVELYYPGKTATKYNEVNIATTQTQTAPNNTVHIGTSGDCGTATANRQPNGSYLFNLDHKAAYICLLPRSSNAFIQRSKIFKIEIISEDNIAGTYTLGMTGLTGAGNSKTITLNTGNGFEVTNTSNNQSLNASYVVIAPGTHNLMIRYWLRNTTDNPEGPIEGTITKYFSGTFAPNTVSPITANLDVPNYSNKYYQYDAYKHYWDGYESVQPTVNGGYNGNYAGDYYDPTHTQPPYEPTYGTAWMVGGRSYSIIVTDDPIHPGTKDMPYFGELTWYARYGNPTYDNELYTVMGHLYKGRILMKKRSVLQTEGHWNTQVNAYGKTKVPMDKLEIGETFDEVGETRDNVTFINYATSQDAITYSYRDQYFALPFLGTYYHGKLEDVGSKGFYWSLTGYDPYDYMKAVSFEVFKDKITITKDKPRGYAMNVDAETMFQ